MEDATDLDYDMRARHYRPAGRSALCGAGARVCDASEQGVLPKHAILNLKCTTDIRKVTCVNCRQWIKEVADKM